MEAPTVEIPVNEDVPHAVRRVIFCGENLATAERLEAIRCMVPPPNAVCIASGLKSGTTWTQQVASTSSRTRGKRAIQIVHGLRSGGDMEYEDIDSEVANLEFSPHGTDICAPQSFQPNMYKTHAPYEQCVKGFSKYIILTRDPKDAAVSLYYYCRGWFFETKDLTLNDFVKYMVAEKIPEDIGKLNALQLHHQVTWYPHRKDPNVLWLHYEDLKEDLKACVKLISDHIGIGVGDQALLDLVEHQATFEFMKAHESKFNDHIAKYKKNEALGLVKTAGLTGDASSKVRDGETKKGKEALSPEMAAAIDHRWKFLFGPITSYQSYDEMRAGINKELGRPFGNQ